MMIEQKVFISSTSIDLKEYRAIVEKTLRQLGLAPIMMENFSAIDSDAVNACIEKVDQADIYIGIYAHRYGHIPAGSEISITEIEFNHARARNIPCLCFMVDDDVPWPLKYVEDDPGKSKLQQFKQRVESLMVRATFTTPLDLALQVTKALYNLPSKSAAYHEQVFAEHTGAQQFLHDYITQNSVQNAQFILFSGMLFLRTTIDVLLRNGAHITLLLKHPASCELEIIRNDLLNTFRTINSFQVHYPNLLDVYLYKNIATYRAVAIDNRILITSWYTYVSNTSELEGHPHPHILFEAPSQDYNHCKRMFDYIFQSLRSNAERLEDYLTSSQG